MSKTNEKLYQGRVVDVVETNGGWTTILDGMKQTKVRNGELSAVPKENSAKDTAPKTGPALTRSDRQAARAAAKKDEKGAKDASGDADTRPIKADLTKYVRTAGIKTPSGRASIDSNDHVAVKLRGMDLGEVYKLAASLMPPNTVASLRDQYGHLNPGMQRMNLGNRIRGALAMSGETL